MTKLRFLLLEDNPADAELVSTTLDNSDLACEFIVVETREDFCQALQSQPIDIVLADYSLPTFTGMEAIKIVNDQFSEIPCILVSGVLGEERAIEAIKSGAANYVLKKRLEQLVPAVKRSLRERQEKQMLARAAAELKKNEARFRTSVEAMADCLVILSAARDAHGTIKDFTVEYINEMARQYLLVSLEEQVGESIYALIPSFRDTGDVYLFSEFCFVVENGRPYQHEVCLYGCQKKNAAMADQFVAIEVRAAKLDNGLVVTWRDVTQRKKLEQQRIRLLAEAEASRTQAIQDNQRKDEFLASFSHELRSPISNISGWLQLLEANQQSADFGDKALEVIQRNAKLLERLASDLLDGFRMTQGKFRCHLVPTELDRLTQIVLEAIESVKPISRDENTRIVFDPPPFPLSGNFSGDAIRLQQVVQNLLSNAIRFTQAQGQIMVDIKQQEAAIAISVKDTGAGMSPDALSHVFERFWQAKQSLNKAESGAGLGLSIVKHIVEAHGGQIKAESEGPDRGSTFTVELPLLDTASDELNSIEVPAARQRSLSMAQPTTSQDSFSDSAFSNSSVGGSLKGIRVLVVDDQADSLDICKTMLEMHGAKVEEASAAAEAIEALRRFRPHVMVSDLAMPDVDGYGLIRQIRALPALEGGCIPAIALSAYTEELDRTRALLAGFQLHIAKPINFKDIVESVALMASQLEPTVRNRA